MYIIVRFSDVVLMHKNDQYVFTSDEVMKILDEYFHNYVVIENNDDISQINEKIIVVRSVKADYIILNLNLVDNPDAFKFFDEKYTEKLKRLAIPFTRSELIDTLINIENGKESDTNN